MAAVSAVSVVAAGLVCRVIDYCRTTAAFLTILKQSTHHQSYETAIRGDVIVNPRQVMGIHLCVYV